MALLNIWKSNKQEVLGMNIEQVVSIAGDGALRDCTVCSEELRGFLQVAPSERLFDYARHCLETAFNKSGLVLQDIVNELGRRLDFDVENGRYQGTKNAVGFDGIWRYKDLPDLIIEVKTTDYITISLDKLADYKERLVSDRKVQRNASILIVVGREDTGALEAQVRGSRFAWDMRLISVERLTKLVQINEKSDDPATLHQIRQLLQPFEYTKIDKIIDVIFTTAVDVEQSGDQEALADSEENESGKQIRTDPELLNAKRQIAVDSFAALKGKELVKRSRTLFSSPDRELCVCCAVSKKYEREDRPYWYRFDRKWSEFLSEAKEGYLVLACMDRDEAFAVPYSWIQAHQDQMNVTEGGGVFYWHIVLTVLDRGALAINLTKVGSKAPLKSYRFTLKSQLAAK